LLQQVLVHQVLLEHQKRPVVLQDLRDPVHHFDLENLVAHLLQLVLVVH
jgi:hypothetical protein